MRMVARMGFSPSRFGAKYAPAGAAAKGLRAIRRPIAAAAGRRA
ncbi:hypothetical protein LNKW23_30730 [Paralimibaculum aggregatum]|uniref:Uncharacterized protein n=1 Tax=Paralimibaculum aggregatum TaxID=3036245 RepID=A0ABQ6LNE5_9RHOB|nr:hypothetical protein LNKW23_30730 [Limibaculum sp. NKW23]